MRTTKLWLTLVLLMVAATTVAQTSATTGRVKTFSNGVTLEYSFSGGYVKEKTTERGGSEVHYVCEIEEGGTIVLDIKRISGPDYNSIKKVSIEHWGPASCQAQVRNKENSAHLEYKLVPGKHAPKMYSYMYAPGCLNGSRSNVFIHWHVVPKKETKNTSKTASAKTQRVKIDNPCNCSDINRYNSGLKDEAPMYRDCGVRFRDIKGDVTVKPCDDDDDGYERAGYETILHYCDQIKTEEDSEATLGLVNKTSYVIKENSCFILPPYEGEVSGIKMVMGTIWVNMKKMMKNGEINIDGTQAVAGIRGTIVAAEETGKETRFWLLAGKVDVTSKATGKKVVLEAGQMTTTGTDGQTKVQKFNIEQAAKKFGIPMSEIRNHYSNTSSVIGDVVVGKDMEYKIISDNTAEVVKCKGSGQVKISNTLNYEGKQYKVVRIAKDAFKGMMNVTTVEIPSNVVTIKEDAFLNCGLTNLTVWADNVRIEQKAFHNCLKLVTATVKGKTPHCSFDAFIGCSSMRELFIRDIKADSYGKKPNGTNAIIKKLK